MAAGLVVSASAEEGARSFCTEPPHDRLCPVFPEDQPDFSRFFEYRVIADVAQDPFDEYAWQAFTALNWRDVAPGDPEGESWRDFARKADMFAVDHAPCPSAQGAVIAGLAQSDGHPLIDQKGDFIVYETRLNPVAAGYLREAGLTTAEGRAAFGGEVDFPRGLQGTRAASVLLKTAWRIEPDPQAGMIEAEGLIPVPAAMSVDGVARCLDVRLGLIGMHVVAKVQSGHGDKWIWATFEHVANAPTAANAREINSLYARDLFPGGCAPPATAEGRDYALYDPARADRRTNAPPAGPVLWAATRPFAVTAAGAPAEPSQIVRCWRVFGPTEETNAAWRTELKGTPLAKYMLVSAQWRGANPDPIFPNGELPRYLSNVALESYVQTDPMGTCLGCHAEARTSEGASSDFTYLLR
ncbi:MAG: hypothetical protein AAFN79_03215 [Pseudomonadota bacterium]